jgi:hypothetical protein
MDEWGVRVGLVNAGGWRSLEHPGVVVWGEKEKPLELVSMRCSLAHLAYQLNKGNQIKS